MPLTISRTLYYSVPHLTCRSLDALTEQQVQDLKRQLQVIEQEATVLRAKTQSLEQDNEKYQGEIKKLQAKAKPAGATSAADTKKLTDSIEQLEKEKQELEGRLKRIVQESTSQLPMRLAKSPNDMHTKLQLRVSFKVVRIAYYSNSMLYLFVCC